MLSGLMIWVKSKDQNQSTQNASGWGDVEKPEPGQSFCG